MSRLEYMSDAYDVVRAGEPYVLEYEQISGIYTAINRREKELRGMSGIGSFVSEVREMTQYFQGRRKEMREE
jgi:hypothetical protein